MGRRRQIAGVLMGLVAALIVASLPLQQVEPDRDARAQMLLRIFEDGQWELLHGPTRLTRTRVTRSRVALQPQGQPEAREALVQLESAMSGLQSAVAAAGAPPLGSLRIEIAPRQPAQVLVQAALLASRLGIRACELSADGRRDTLPIGLLPRDETFLEDETERLRHSLVLDEQGGRVFSVVLQLHTTTWEEDAETTHDFELSTETDRLVNWTTPLHRDGRMALLPDPLLDVLWGVGHGLHRPRRITLSVTPRPQPTLSSRTVVDLLKMIVEQTPHAIDLTGFSLVRFAWTTGG